MLLAALLAGLLAPRPALAGLGEAADKVRQGIAQYQAGQYRAAAEAFAAADLARPDDPRIMFDRAAALESQGDLEKAAALYQKAALGSDQDLVARCRYNLGCLAAAQARARFGEHPENATPEVRQEGLGLLLQAIGHFRDCLRGAPEHRDARHNLELIRLWIKHMEALWQERDRQKQRKDMDLVEFLEMLQGQQRGLRQSIRALTAEPDSPKRRQAVTATETAQRRLGAEIKPLEEKIRQTLTQPPGAAAGAPGVTAGLPGSAPSAAAGSPGNAPVAAASPDAQKAIEILSRLADEAGAAMTSAAEQLRGGAPAAAVKPQEQAVDKLNEIAIVVLPFARLLTQSIDTQQQLLAEEGEAGLPGTAASSLGPVPGGPGGPPTSKQSTAGATAGLPGSVPATTRGEKNTSFDFDDAAWNQDFVTGWAKILAPKARHELQGLAAAGDAANPAGPAAPANDPAQAKKQAEEAQKQREGIKRALEKAVELGPRVADLSAAATPGLHEKHPADAGPKQEEALKLLRQIAESLPKQNQNKDQNQDQKKQDQKQQNRDQQSPQQKQPQQPRDLSQQQAESLMRQVRQRQHQRQQLEKQFQQFRYRPDNVEKDW